MEGYRVHQSTIPGVYRPSSQDVQESTHGRLPAARTVGLLVIVDPSVLHNGSGIRFISGDKDLLTQNFNQNQLKVT